MRRPGINGPRSFTLTRTERPLRTFVTLTRLPNGSLGCAAVSAWSSKRSPLAVPGCRFVRSYQLATPYRV